MKVFSSVVIESTPALQGAGSRPSFHIRGVSTENFTDSNKMSYVKG